MTSNKSPNALAAEWKDACNSHDLDRVALEYRVGDGLHGIEFTTVDADWACYVCGRQ